MRAKPIYAFIDSQNLNLAVRSLGWQLDFSRFRRYLADKYQVTKAFLFLGFVPTNESLYTSLQRAGYILVFKPTLKLSDGTVKGNVDAELVLHAMIEREHYVKAIIVSGDGDFHCLIEHLEKEGKLLHVLIPNPRKYSALLRRFRKYFVFIDRLEKKLGTRNERE
jgi:uncharacterized LabA/DUF88 family protein